MQYSLVASRGNSHSLRISQLHPHQQKHALPHHTSTTTTATATPSTSSLKSALLSIHFTATTRSALNTASSHHRSHHHPHQRRTSSLATITRQFHSSSLLRADQTNAFEDLKKLFDRKDEVDNNNNQNNNNYNKNQNESTVSLEEEIKRVEKLLRGSIAEDIENRGDQDIVFRQSFDDLKESFSISGGNPLLDTHSKIERESFLARGLHELPTWSPTDSLKLSHAWMAWLGQTMEQEEDRWKELHGFYDHHSGQSPEQSDPLAATDLPFATYFPPNKIPDEEAIPLRRQRDDSTPSGEETPVKDHRCEWCLKEVQSRREFHRKLKISSVYFDPLNVPFLLRYLSVNGRILPRRITNNCKKHQKALATVIKRAQHMGFFTHKQSVYKIESPFAFRVMPRGTELEFMQLDASLELDAAETDKKRGGHRGEASQQQQQQQQQQPPPPPPPPQEGEEGGPTPPRRGDGGWSLEKEMYSPNDNYYDSTGTGRILRGRKKFTRQQLQRSQLEASLSSVKLTADSPTSATHASPTLDSLFNRTVGRTASASAGAAQDDPEEEGADDVADDASNLPEDNIVVDDEDVGPPLPPPPPAASAPSPSPSSSQASSTKDSKPTGRTRRK